jgi:CheY-like chemotaxis protein
MPKMTNDVVLLIVEDDDGHAALIKKNLQRAGIANPILHFKDGQAILDYLFHRGAGPFWTDGLAVVLLLDIRMPKVDGIEVLRQIKQHPEFRKIPIIMLTTTDDPREVEHCHMLGCNNYITKPVDYDKFMTAVRQLGLFLMVVEVPQLHGT